MTLYHFKSDLLICALFDTYNKRKRISNNNKGFPTANCTH